MGILIGSTGFVGGHLASHYSFDEQVHRSDVERITGATTDLVVCAGLPAEKWRANKDPESDWVNMSRLAQILTTIHADRAVLISTIDVYQPAVGVDESHPANFDGKGAYGAHRAWFEAFFRAQFTESLIIRLPALFAADVRKNLVHDLLHGQSDHWAQVNPESTFQFFDAQQTWRVIEQAWARGLCLLNVTSEPVSAQEIADVFGVTLRASTPATSYDMRSRYAKDFGGSEGYLYHRESTLNGIAALRREASYR